MKKLIYHNSLLFTLLLFANCRNVSKLQSQLEQNVDEIRITFIVGNIPKRYVEKKQLTVVNREEIRNLCYIVGEHKKPRMACAHTGHIDYLSNGKIILTLDFTLNCMVVVNRRGLGGFSQNLTAEGHRILKGYCDDLLKQLGPDWHCANSEKPEKEN